MSDSNPLAVHSQVEALVARLRGAPEAARVPVRAELLALAGGEDGSVARDHLANLRRGELLEVQWEIEDVLEATTPKKPAPPPAPEVPAPIEDKKLEDPNRPLTAADLTLVYDDPRGVMLHKSKVGGRYFLTQVDPRTQQPQTFELHPTEVEQIKGQLAGSPYWLLGS